MDPAEEIDAVLPDLPRNSQRDLLVAALAQMQEMGYHATSTRSVAKAAGMSPAAVYVHYPSKEALLYGLAKAGHNAVLRAVRDALATAGDDPRDRVVAYVESYTTWHAEHACLARVVNYELQHLSDVSRAEVLEVRREIEALLRIELQAGVAAKSFVLDDLDTTRLALLSLGIDVARWAASAKNLDPASLGKRYAMLAARLLGPPSGELTA